MKTKNTTFSGNLMKLIIAGGLIFLFSKQDFELSFNTDQTIETMAVNLKTENETVAEDFDFFKRNWYHLKKIWGKTFSNKEEKKLDDQINNFIKRFQRLAIEEQTAFGIPASIIMAHCMLQSNYGNSEAASSGSNFFGLKCSNDWKGDTMEVNGHCFRKYNSIKTSFRDNSFFLTTGYFSGIKFSGNTDYKYWAKEISKQAPFNSDKNYAKQLIQLIEKRELNRLDVLE